MPDVLCVKLCEVEHEPGQLYLETAETTVT